jgi:predicted transcriptional regulator
LSIKDREADEPVRALAAATGETLTTAVATAVRERLERVSGAVHASDPEAQLNQFEDSDFGKADVTPHGALRIRWARVPLRISRRGLRSVVSRPTQAVSIRYRECMAMTLRLGEELDEKLTALAAAQRVSKQQLVLRELENYVDRMSHAARVRSLAAQAAADYPNTLRRLGE